MFIRLLLLALFTPIAVLAQTDTTFFYVGQVTTREHADMYRPVATKEGEKYKIVDYFMADHKVAREGYSYSADSVIYDGPYVEYYMDGRKREYGTYLKGNKVGQWRLKYEDTDRIWAVTAHIPGADTTEMLTSFYKNGKVKRKQWTSADKLSGICYDESGKEIPYTAFTQMPEFIGDFHRYLGMNIRYPENARVREIEGIVYVQFIVNENGSIDVTKVRGPHTSLCNEATRVVKKMPKWKPGIMDDRPVKVSYTAPVVFRLE